MEVSELIPARAIFELESTSIPYIDVDPDEPPINRGNLQVWQIKFDTL